MNRLGIFLRAVLSLGLVVCLYLVVRHGMGAWYYRQRTIESLQKAIRWDPRNPLYYATLARTLQYSLAAGDPEEVTSLYQKATQLSPHNADYWAGLGEAYESAGRIEDAKKAFERARILFPNSPDINWHLGNFYLRAGEKREAVQAFQKAILGDPQYRRPAFDLAWRAEIDPQLLLAEMIPPEMDTLFPYLNYLSDTDRMDEAARVWEQILALGRPFEVNLAFRYLDRLIDHHEVGRLQAAWAALVERNPTRFRRRAFDPNLMTNGDFESEIINGGLGWRVRPAEGVPVAVDGLTFFDGTRSLRLEFDGKHNVDYSHVFQYVPVKPNTSYRFVGYMRTQGITTDSGPRFQAYDAYQPSNVLVETEQVLGSSSWSAYSEDFRTGPTTELLVVRVRRPPSRKFDNQIGGTLWIDRIILNPVAGP